MPVIFIQGASFAAVVCVPQLQYVSQDLFSYPITQSSSTSVPRQVHTIDVQYNAYRSIVSTEAVYVDTHHPSAPNSTWRAVHAHYKDVPHIVLFEIPQYILVAWSKSLAVICEMPCAPWNVYGSLFIPWTRKLTFFVQIILGKFWVLFGMPSLLSPRHGGIC